MPKSGSCRSSFTSRMRMMDGTWVSARVGTGACMTQPVRRCRSIAPMGARFDRWRVNDQAGGGWKMEGLCPAGRAAGSSGTRRGGAASVSRRTRRGPPTDRGRPELGRGRRHGPGDAARNTRDPSRDAGDRAGPPGPGRVVREAADERPVIRSSSRLWSSSRSDCEVTRWLHPARADPGRGEAVGQEQHQCPRPPPRQSLERNRPHGTPAATVTGWETSHPR